MQTLDQKIAANIKNLSQKKDREENAKKNQEQFAEIEKQLQELQKSLPDWKITYTAPDIKNRVFDGQYAASMAMVDVQNKLGM